VSLAMLGMLAIGILGTLGVRAAGLSVDPGRQPAVESGAAAQRVIRDAPVLRTIPAAYVSGALLVALLTTSALTIVLARRPRRRPR
jgi:hypothetical protein